MGTCGKSRLLERRSTAVDLQIRFIHGMSEVEAGYQASLQCLSCILLGPIRLELLQSHGCTKQADL